jgi:AcrR family transcriptional regulator
MATRNSTTRTAPARKPGVRELAAQATRDSILRAATKVFAKHGYDGGRVEQISKAAKSYDRMIYYYFGSKEELFIAVLEETYRRFNR